MTQTILPSAKARISFSAGLELHCEIKILKWEIQSRL